MSQLRIKTKIILCIVSFWATSASAQFDLKGFLSDASKDDQLASYQAQIDFLNEENLRSPWIQRIEVRSRSNDFNLSQEDFRFRIGPTNPREIKANKDYFRAQQKLTDIQYQLALNEALVDRYQVFLKWQYLWQRKELVEKEQLVIEDLLNLYTESVNSLDFDYEDYLEKDKDRTLLELELRKIDHQIRKEEFRIREVFDYHGNIEPGGAMLSVERIRTMFLQNDQVDDSTHLKLLELEQELALSNYDYKVDKAENRRNIGYIQAEFDSDRGNEFQDHMGFQFGIRIPITNPDRPDLQRTRLDLLDDQYDSEREKKWLEIERLEAEMDLKYLLSEYEFLNGKLIIYKERRKKVQSANENPAILLKNMENSNRLEKALLTIRSSIYIKYVEILDLYGWMVQMPLRNYLSEELELIDAQ